MFGITHPVQQMKQCHESEHACPSHDDSVESVDEFVQRMGSISSAKTENELLCCNPSSWTALHNVGRLDRDSEGLLLLTTDGQFTAQVLSSPTCLKTYWAMVDGGELSTESLQSLRNDGMVIRNSLTRPPASVETFSSSCSEQKISAPHQSTFDHLYPHLPSPVPGMEESRCRR